LSGQDWYMAPATVLPSSACACDGEDGPAKEATNVANRNEKALGGRIRQVPFALKLS
jgi:hypothetical protein